jgi:glucosyl-dolichyl phosphate glucuronosyltransferase
VSARITVVLPTFRRPDGLARALGAMAEQREVQAPWDVVVVDNDDPPGAGPTFSSLAPRLPVPVRLLHEPRRGASSARNAGIAAAEGDIVAFLDDDVVPAPTWLSNLFAPLLAGRAEAAGGVVRLDPAVPLPRWLGADWRGYLSEYDRGGTEHDIGDHDYVLSANAAFRTDLLRRIGGFDPVLGPRPGVPMVNDDIDLCRRAMRAGGPIRYVPDAVVVHELPSHRLKRRYLLRRAYAQGRSDWLLERDVNVGRPLGGAGGMLVHLRRLLADRTHEGLWYPDAAMGAVLHISQVSGFLREAAAQKAPRRRR